MAGNEGKSLDTSLRYGSLGVEREDVGKFPFDAFSFETPDTDEPELTLNSPWKFRSGGYSVIYKEISSDVDYTNSGYNVNGTQLVIHNTDTAAHTVTFAVGISEPIAPGELFTAYYTTAWILDHYTSTVSTSITYTPTHRTNICLLDTSSGNTTVPISLSSAFVGMRILSVADGSGIAKNTGTGLYTNGIYISDGYSVEYEVIDNGGTLELKVCNHGISAKYTSGDFLVELYSNGKARYLLNVSGTASSTTANYFGSVSGTTYYYTEPTKTFPISFVSTPYIHIGLDTARSARVLLLSTTATGTIEIFAGGTSTSVSSTYVFEGEYS